ncbi:putative DNA-binding domain-containing protein [Marinomonas polaris]|jgi:hypothetical protein|uniref:HvfC/BufC family peptide modification chaperone n=1 Tax=Marinomonas polaris TaxID=293552 RepID=UPI00351173EC
MNYHFKHALLNESEHFNSEIKASSEEEKTVRLNVYRNNIYVSLIDALADIFPVTQMLVGEDFFRAMAREFISQNPPKNPVISEYGDDFSNFLRHFEPVQSLPYLADLAALERSLLMLTNSPECNTLEHHEVSAAFEATTNPGDLLLGLSPCCQIITSNFAIGSIYQAHKIDSQKSINNLPINNNEHLLLSKIGIYGTFYLINEDELGFFNALLQGKTLENAVPDSEHFDLGATLAKLIEWKLLTHVTEITV